MHLQKFGNVEAESLFINNLILSKIPITASWMNSVYGATNLHSWRSHHCESTYYSFNHIRVSCDKFHAMSISTQQLRIDDLWKANERASKCAKPLRDAWKARARLRSILDPMVNRNLRQGAKSSSPVGVIYCLDIF